ncbi:glycoside hydrolase [Mucilaginibacter daejeonensis]|uniref:MGH1-like glycoside hydrolase domain-containing protein n=1 Tax=Mucilaginibacter daejeonensis TaxID=398049 RepID=UPI001D1745E5|nr:glycosyl hydrolase family 65 protein [Mucilaginibacter daejeonensis]UEG52862.1 glycoside hydrolase [Mucilaginibacter daejeonensis]
MKKTIFSLALGLTTAIGVAQTKPGLGTDKLKFYVESFNKIDTETVKNYVTNDQAYEFLSKNAPLFECPDSTIEKIYYYRWWAFRKHLKQTPDGFVFTEFITQVNHAGKYNTVSSALGHHIYEGRWMRDPQYLDQYINFWLYIDPKTPKPHLHAFSSWLQDAVYNYYLVNQNKATLQKQLPVLDADYRQWETEKMAPNQMFWQFDVRDAMEESISGGRKDKNIRPTINSYMYGNAVALTKMAKLFGNDTLMNRYQAKAAQLKRMVQDTLWDNEANFFKVKQVAKGKLADAREELGFIPWYFNLPDDKVKYAEQWEQLTDEKGFNAPWGITTAERRHPLFRTHGTGHGCEWDGAVWPFATTQTLKGLANLLTNYKHQDGMSKQVFYTELHKYAASHTKRGLPYLGEYQDEKTGYWLKGDNPRSSYYNHSGFADIVISDLVGLKPRDDNKLEVYPLIPDGLWDWFCLDKVPYHGHEITVRWDKTGNKYKQGAGLYIYADGKQLAKSKDLKHIITKLP